MTTYLRGHHDNVLCSGRLRRGRPFSVRLVLRHSRGPGLVGEMHADRIVDSRIATEAVDRGLARADELSEIAAGWRPWAAGEDGWFAVLHGELLRRVAA